MNKNIGIIIGIIVILGFGYFVFSGENKDTNKVAEVTPAVQNEVKEPEQPVAPGAFATEKGLYEAYSVEKLAMAETGQVVIFFHASWCPSCRALNNDIEANVDAIPEGVTILKTDYDKETELKKKYGVTTQHTLVQVDKDGNMIKKWSGGSKLENLIMQLQ